MGKDTAKMLNSFVVDKVEIGESAAGVEPVSYTDIGLVDDEKLTIKAVPSRRKEIGGGNLQITNLFTVETSMMQVLDYTVAEGFKNKNCWIKATAKDGAIVRVKNVMINVELDGQVFANGKSALMITGEVYAKSIGDVFAHATS